MDLATRKEVEIDVKLANLQAESLSWRQSAKVSFPQHKSQIEAAWGILDGLCNKAQEHRTELSVQKLSTFLLAIHRLWEFFRSKFIQRKDEDYKQYLAWADQLAWNSYKPVRALAVKAPPLVFLNGGFSPFVVKRGSQFQAEFVTRENLTDDALTAQKQLPFPIIGVPYYQVRNLAEMPSIGHEVGHVVEEDLELTSELDQLVAHTLGPDHPRFQYWKGWRRELFADVWGCFTTGPAFASALADFKSGQEEESSIPIEDTAYPPPWLRIAFTRIVLEAEPLKLNVKEVLEPYENTFDCPAGNQDFLADAKLLASAMLTHKFTKFGTLVSLLTFTSAQSAEVEKAAKGLFATPARAVPKTVVDIRVAVAIYRRAYDLDARGVFRPGTWRRLTQGLDRCLTTDQRPEGIDVSKAARARADALAELFLK